MHRIGQTHPEGFRLWNVCAGRTIREPSPNITSGSVLLQHYVFMRSIKQQQVLLVDKAAICVLFRAKCGPINVKCLHESRSVAASLYTAANVNIRKRKWDMKINSVDTILTKDIWLDKLKMSFTVTYNIILNQKKMHVQASTEHFYIKKKMK